MNAILSKWAVGALLATAAALLVFVGWPTLTGERQIEGILLGLVAPILLAAVAAIIEVLSASHESSRPLRGFASSNGDAMQAAPRRLPRSSRPPFVALILIVSIIMTAVVYQDLTPRGDGPRRPDAPQQEDPVPEGLPGFGEYVYVQELPEPTHRVAPAYPELARISGVDGTVMVQALIGKDGRVVKTRVVKSIPLLDEAAASAVGQWTFKPARADGDPVAVWVAVPVKFSLH